jgi:hypothetical protein
MIQPRPLRAPTGAPGCRSCNRPVLLVSIAQSTGREGMAYPTNKFVLTNFVVGETLEA